MLRRRCNGVGNMVCSGAGAVVYWLSSKTKGARVVPPTQRPPSPSTPESTRRSDEGTSFARDQSHALYWYAAFSRRPFGPFTTRTKKAHTNGRAFSAVRYIMLIDLLWRGNPINKNLLSTTPDEGCTLKVRTKVPATGGRVKDYSRWPWHDQCPVIGNWCSLNWSARNDCLMRRRSYGFGKKSGSYHQSQTSQRTISPKSNNSSRQIGTSSIKTTLDSSRNDIARPAKSPPTWAFPRRPSNGGENCTDANLGSICAGARFQSCGA